MLEPGGTAALAGRVSRGGDGRSAARVAHVRVMKVTVEAA
jgi:hypothetical protein